MFKIQINYFFKKDENLSSGISNISILSSSINTKFNIKDQIAIFQSDGSRIYNSKIDYNGQLALNPFDLNLKINLYDYKISNLFTPNSIINEFIKSGLLFNENISVNISMNINKVENNEVFKSAVLYFNIVNGNINFNKTRLVNKKIGVLELGSSNLFFKDSKLIFNTDLTIDVQDSDKLFF